MTIRGGAGKEDSENSELQKAKRKAYAKRFAISGLRLVYIMEGQLQNQPKPQTDVAAVRKPAIRTMKSDVQELFKTTKPSLLQIIGQNDSVETSHIPPNIRSKPFLLVVGAVIVAFALVLGGLYIWSRRAPVAVPKIVVPGPIFAVESSRTFSIDLGNSAILHSLLADTHGEEERLGQIKRILVKVSDQSQEHYATFADFVRFYRMSPPRGLTEQTEGSFMPFFFASRDGNRFGIAVKIADPDRVWADMLFWEPSLVYDIRPLFFEDRPETIIAPFEDRTYRNIDWRFQKLSDESDLGVAYTVFPARNILVVTSSKETMETVINRLFDAP